MVKHSILALMLCSFSLACAQSDSILNKNQPLKIGHAEPVYMDLIRDLGARKGEKELNIGWEMNDRSRYLEQGGFIEYEFAPVNRLGLEVEMPFNYYNAERLQGGDALPNEKIEGLKLAAQYTFLVSGRYQLSMAAGTIYEMELHSFKTMSKKHKVLKGYGLNPFLIAAKRWGRCMHSLLYTGPVLDRSFDDRQTGIELQTNASLHYQLPQSGHLLGLEINHKWDGRASETVIRPQLKLRLDAGFALGVATGIPVDYRDEGLSFVARLIYELRAK